VPGQTPIGWMILAEAPPRAVVTAPSNPHIPRMARQYFIHLQFRTLIRFRAFLVATLLAMPALLSAPAAQAEPLAEAIDRIDGNVLFLRHALAPGFGDPPQFDIDDCATQRNLNDVGRDQARAIGAYMTRHDITPDIVLSSQWCRCQDTARDMAIGPFSTHIGLNSFFDGHVDRDRTLAALREHMAQVGPDRLELLVTHQVVISAITGIAPQSGGMVVYNSRTGEAVSVPLPIE